MKKNILIIGLLALGFSAVAGVPETNPDTTRLKFPGVKVIIIENEDKSEENEVITVDSDTIGIWEEQHSPEEFCHWHGIDQGVVGYTTPSQDFQLGDDAKFAELDYGSSFAVNLNLFQKTFPLIQDYVTLSTGLGFSLNRYGFKHNVSLNYNSDSTWGYTDSLRTYSKNFLKVTYVEAPLLLTFNTGKDPNRSLHLSAGVIGGYKIGSKYKRKWEEDDDKNVDKRKGDYNVNPFRLYATARLGYGKVTVFANYALTSFFEPGRGPELYPFSAGISVIPF